VREASYVATRVFGPQTYSGYCGGHHTSVSLEYEFWKGLREIADRRGERLAHLIASIDAEREFGNLSSVLRVFVLEFHREQYSAESLSI
jgi:predicted DNA-binding ribbon-helix-helix protein